MLLRVEPRRFGEAGHDVRESPDSVCCVATVLLYAYT